MQRVCFEDMKEEYVEFALEIYNYYILNTTVTFHMQALSKNEMKRILFFNDETYRSFVIKSDGEICGYVILGKHKERPAYDVTAEVAIYLQHGFTGKGIGSRAVQFIENVARQNTKLHSLIATVCSENEKSMRLFEQNGYTKCAHYREVGKKFGKYLDLVAYQKILD